MDHRALATEGGVRGTAGGEVFSPADVRRIIDQAPHMLLEHDEAIFTSVFVLEKRENRG